MPPLTLSEQSDPAPSSRALARQLAASDVAVMSALIKLLLAKGVFTHREWSDAVNEAQALRRSSFTR